MISRSIYLNQGDNYQIKFRLLKKDGTPYNLEDQKLYMQIKNNIYSNDYVITPFEPQFKDKTTGLIIFNITSEQTQNLKCGEYISEIRYINMMDYTHETVQRFSIYILKSVINDNLNYLKIYNNALSITHDLFII